MSSIQHYRAFVAVMEAGSVTGASRAMGRTQPQVSRLVAALEKELGFELFARERRRLVPTPQGARFYEEARRALDGIDNLGVIAGQIASGRADILRILAPNYVAHSFLPEALARLRMRLPQQRFAVEIVARNSIGSWITFHPFDVGVAALPFEQPGIKVERLARVEAVVVLPKGHRLCGKRMISLDDLAGEPFVTLRPNIPLRQRLDETFQACGFVPNIVVETSSSSSACELAAKGLGFTIVDVTVALPRSADLDLVLKRWQPGLTSEFGFIYPASSGLTKPAAEFVRVVTDVVLKAHPKLITASKS